MVSPPQIFCHLYVSAIPPSRATPIINHIQTLFLFVVSEP
jgi:hypothetical protein